MEVSKTYTDKDADAIFMLFGAVVDNHFPKSEITEDEKKFCAGVLEMMLWSSGSESRLPQLVDVIVKKVKVAGYRKLPHEIAEAERKHWFREILSRLPPNVAAVVKSGKRTIDQGIDDAMAIFKMRPSPVRAVESCEFCGVLHSYWAPHEVSEFLFDKFVRATGLMPTWEHLLGPCPEVLQGQIVELLKRTGRSIESVASAFDGCHKTDYEKILVKWLERIPR